MLFENHIVILNGDRKEVLRWLHESHQGIDRTKRRARQTILWPGIAAYIEERIGICEKCLEQGSSRLAEPLQSDPPPTRPSEDVGADLIQYAGIGCSIIILPGIWIQYQHKNWWETR